MRDQRQEAINIAKRAGFVPILTDTRIGNIWVPGPPIGSTRLVNSQAMQVLDVYGHTVETFPVGECNRRKSKTIAVFVEENAEPKSHAA